MAWVRALRAYLDRRRLISRLGLVRRRDMAMFGSPYGGYRVPTSLLDERSVCYLAGTGEDISFDLALIERFGCEVYAFDPVPRAAAYVAQATAAEPRYRFMGVGLWSSDTTLTFHAPTQPSFVSYSATNLQGTEAALKAPVRSLASLMGELGHGRLGLLKISAEGAEFEILDHVLDANVEIGVLCVEFAQPADFKRVLEYGRRLRAAGYRLVGAGQWRQWKFTFVHAGRGPAPQGSPPS